MGRGVGNGAQRAQGIRGVRRGEAGRRAQQARAASAGPIAEYREHFETLKRRSGERLFSIDGRYEQDGKSVRARISVSDPLDYGDGDERLRVAWHWPDGEEVNGISEMAVLWFHRDGLTAYDLVPLPEGDRCKEVPRASWIDHLGRRLQTTAEPELPEPEDDDDPYYGSGDEDLDAFPD